MSGPVQEPVDPFAGWTMAFVGCHWSRGLPDGRTVHMSTWQRGRRDGYSLTVDYQRTEYPDLAAALEAFQVMAADARKATDAAP